MNFRNVCCKCFFECIEICQAPQQHWFSTAYNLCLTRRTALASLYWNCKFLAWARSFRIRCASISSNQSACIFFKKLAKTLCALTISQCFSRQHTHTHTQTRAALIRVRSEGLDRSACAVLGRRMRRAGCHSRRIAAFPAKENASTRGGSCWLGAWTLALCARGSALCLPLLSALISDALTPKWRARSLKCVPIGGKLSYAEHSLTMPMERAEGGRGRAHNCSRIKQ